MKLVTVIGTRPEAIKMAPLCRALNVANGVSHRLLATGQHRQMLDSVLDFFELTPDIDLNVMQPGQTLARLTAHLLGGITDALSSEKPDGVLVHGDTTTAMAGSLAAFYLGIPVFHVEAGLRTHNMHSPWPEEFNRRSVALMARHHFAPTETAKGNLLREAVAEDTISVTGNTVIDALLWAKDSLGASKRKPTPAVAEVIDQGLPIILVTGHRRENFGHGFERICNALGQIASQRPDHLIVYPVHLNPNVRDPVHRLLGQYDNIRLIEPQDYPDFVRLMLASTLILTDSGGIQEEAPSLGKPVLVMRDTTERPEAVAAGTVKLVGTDDAQIVSAVTELLDNPEACARMTQAHNPYGDGRAVERIVGEMVKKLYLTGSKP
jgi:UDP-N-acetylglucosamine 2-epimerase (non-hydrolysing)